MTIYNSQKNKVNIIKRALTVLIVLFALAIAGCQTALPPEPGTPGGPVGQAISALPPGYASPDGKFYVDQDVVSEPEEKGDVIATVKNEKYVYRYGYVLINNQWKKIEYSGNLVGKSNWLYGAATAEINVEGMPEGEYWILAYGCNKQGSNWDCNDNMWMIQKYEIVRGLPPEPFDPMEPDYSGLTRYPDVLIENQIGLFNYIGSWYAQDELSETSTMELYYASYEYSSELERGYGEYRAVVFKFESRQDLEETILNEEDLGYLMSNPTQLDNGYYVYKPQWEDNEEFVLWTQDNNLIAIVADDGDINVDISDLVYAYLERYPSDVNPPAQTVCGDGVCSAQVSTETIMLAPNDATSYGLGFWNQDWQWLWVDYYLTPEGNIMLGTGPSIDQKIYVNGQGCLFYPTGTIEDCEGAKFIFTDNYGSTHLMEVSDINTVDNQITIRDVTYGSESTSYFDRFNQETQYVDLPSGAGYFTLRASSMDLMFLNERYGGFAYDISKTAYGAELTITDTGFTLTSEKMPDSGMQDSIYVNFENSNGVLTVPWLSAYSSYGITIEQTQQLVDTSQNEVRISYPDNPIETADNCPADCYPNYLFVVDDTAPIDDVIMMMNLMSEIQYKTGIPIGATNVRSEVTIDMLRGMVTTFIYQGQALVIVGEDAPTSDVVKAQNIIQYLDEICVYQSNCVSVTAKLIEELPSDDLRDAMPLQESQGFDDLGDYPAMFIDEYGQFNGYIVIGQNADSEDAISLNEIADALRTVVPQVTAKLDTEIVDATAQNLIVIGGPCYNSVAVKVMGFPADCTFGLSPGEARIALFKHANGKVVVLVYGYDVMATRRAARVLANWQDYAAYGEGKTSVLVTGTTLTDIVVS